MNKEKQIVLTLFAALAVALAICPLAGTSTVRGSESEPRPTEARRIDFARDVLPIFQKHCYGCHTGANPDSGYRIDHRTLAISGGDSGEPAIVPHRPEASPLFRYVSDPASPIRMPPEDADAAALSPDQINVLRQWIARGPHWPDSLAGESEDGETWWSLRPLTPKPVGDLPDALANGNHPIDAFVFDRLAREGISPVSHANRATLIRRLYFDLHGLPPTPVEVDTFVADANPNAYERLVDALLASPRYGERWARHWLDTVHFADSHGCEHDVFRPNAWRYRDYVIDSFNRDTPWAAFIRQQLAADRFFPDEPHLTAALGFIAAGPLELSRAGTAPVTFEYLDRDDMVTQTMAAFASTTANCARCHDHKFDPVTQEDYYALQAVFAGVGKGDVAFDLDPETAKRRHQFQALIHAIDAGDTEQLRLPNNVEAVSRWEAAFARSASLWEPLDPRAVQSDQGSTLTLLEDRSLLATEHRPEKDTYTITSASTLDSITALRLDVLTDDRLPMKGPGRQDNGNLHLNEIEIFVVRGGSHPRRRLEIRDAHADWNQAGWTIAHAIDGNEASAWGIYPKVGESHHAVFVLAQPLTMEPEDRIIVALKQLHGGGHLIGRLKLFVTNAADPSVAESVPESVSTAIKVARPLRTDAQQTTVAAYALRKHAEQQLAALPAQGTVFAASRDYSHGKKLAQPISLPKAVHVLHRGDIDQPGDVALPGALAVIETLPGRFPLDDVNDEASRRAALADWLAAHENPLTWRSVVNRVWAYHFGRGLCDSPNDFGRMGDVPTHPELLDWLAIWFRDEAKGSLKQLHRLILTSETWQRESRTPASQSAASGSVANAQSIDAGNRLLWRMNRRRMDAESFRDAILHMTDRIDLTMGGPGIQQFTQSPGQQTTPRLDYDAFDWESPSASRRSIYRVVWRGIQDPFMEAMDFPDMALLAPKRSFSVSALQALSVYNNDFVLTHSRRLAERLEAEGTSIDDQVRRACRLIYLRKPDEAEQVAMTRYASEHSMAALCRVLFNSNEFLFIE